MVEDVGPGIAPLCGGLFDLRGSAMRGKKEVEGVAAPRRCQLDCAATKPPRCIGRAVHNGRVLTLFSIWSLSLKSRNMASMSASLGVRAMKGRRPNFLCILCMATAECSGLLRAWCEWAEERETSVY